LKLDQLKEANLIDSSNRESIIRFFNSGIINFKDLSLKKQEITFSQNEKESTTDILKKLEEAKKESLETLKTPKKELVPKPLAKIDNSHIKREQPLNQTEIPFTLPLQRNKEVFLDSFGNLPSIHPDLISKIKININNLLNSRIVNPNFFDVENLFYYISILKMLGIENPFSQAEILEIIKKYVSNKIFRNSDKNIADTITNFYGIALLMELGIPTERVLIDFKFIEDFITNELKKFIPRKLQLNYYAHLSLLLLGKEDTIQIDKKIHIDQLKSINLLQEKNHNLISDIYFQLSTLKIIDKNIDLSELKKLYIDEIKKLFISEGVGGDLLTATAKVLLIFDLVDVKEQEVALCNRLLNYLTVSTSFFGLDNLDKDFNWRIDQLAYKVELKMLFWVLLASSQYAPLNILYL
jgi:hypothetical protein